MAPQVHAYVGDELSLFAEAKNFHLRYVGLFGSDLRGKVLEVGAGMGTFTGYLRGCVESVTACEPDPVLLEHLRTRFGSTVTAIAGGIADVPDAAGPFDAIVYVDVLEHIEDDVAEVGRAAALLKPGGALLIGGPAHPYLFSPFDDAIGHCRRYNRTMVDQILVGNAGLVLERFCYFDSAGMVLSLANRWVSKRSAPTRGQIRFWDRVVLPFSRVVDPLLMYRLGKSFVAVLRAR